MSDLLRSWLRPFAILLLGLSLAAQSAGSLVAYPGGDNAGGTGVWILPFACEFEAPQAASGSALIRIPGLSLVLPGEWTRVGDDLFVSIQGALLASAVHFFDPAAAGGPFLEVSGARGRWLRQP